MNFKFKQLFNDWPVVGKLTPKNVNEVPASPEYHKFIAGYEKDVANLDELSAQGRDSYADEADHAAALLAAKDTLISDYFQAQLSPDFDQARASWDVFSRSQEILGNIFVPDKAPRRNRLYTGITNEAMKNYVAGRIDIESAAARVVADSRIPVEKIKHQSQKVITPAQVIESLQIMIDSSPDQAKQILQGKLARFQELLRENKVEF